MTLRADRMKIALTFSVFAVLAMSAGGEYGRADTSPNSQPNPYRWDEQWVPQLPGGRTWGSSAGVAVDAQGHVWVAERCGENALGCAGKTVDPIVELDQSGKFLRSFGGGIFVQPHGITVDKDGNVWVTDVNMKDGRGNQVFKFSSVGKILLTLGKAGVAGTGPDTFNQPSGVAIAPNGDIFVADGHGGASNARIVKFDRTGRFIKEWGKKGTGQGEFDTPHAVAFDSRGRLFVGDRANNRIQIFDQNGKFLEEWTQFSRPSGIFIDVKRDVLYVVDSESRAKQGYGYHPGWQRGIRIGSAKTGEVTAFIPDPEPKPDSVGSSGAEGIAVDASGNVYAFGDHRQSLVAQKKWVKK
jgi:DNA-binding beta-propeller fold protein YncE